MKNKNLFYKESGNVNLSGFLISIIICVSFSILLGYAYPAVYLSIKYLYFIVIITLILGALIGLSTYKMGEIFHNRNKKSIILLTIIFGLLTNYFQWVAYLLYAFGDLIIPGFILYLSSLNMIFDLNNFIDIIVELNSMEIWTIDEESGMSYSDYVLTAVWILETLIIVGFPVIVILNIYKTIPYSENFSQWYPEYSLLKDFASIPSADYFIEELKKDPLKSIKELGDRSDVKYTKVYLYYLPNEDNQYLTFGGVDLNRKKSGKSPKYTIIKNFIINKSTAISILEHFKTHK